MNKIELNQLDRTISEAKKYALEQIKGVPDDGSCNFDHVVVKIGRTMRTNIQAMVNRGWKDYRCKSYLHVSGGNVGQANRQTVYAEAMRDYLKGKGYDCYVHYQLD